MSLLGTQVYANPDTPCWVSAGGDTITGNLTVTGEVVADSGFVTYDAPAGGYEILNAAGTSQQTRLIHLPAPSSRTMIQTNDPLYIGQIGTANANTSLTVTAYNPGAPNDALNVGGSINAYGNDGFSVYTAAGVRKVAILNQVGQSGIQSDDPLFFSRIGLPAQTSLTLGVSPAPDTLSVGGTVAAQRLSLTTGGAAPSCGSGAILVGQTNVVIPTTVVTANSIILVSHSGAAAAGPGNGAAQGGLTVNPALIVPGVSFRVDLVDPTTGIAVAAAVVNSEFNYLIIN